MTMPTPSTPARDHIAGADDLSDAAIDWLVRVRMGAADAADFARWRATSAAHDAAAIEAEALFDDVGATATAAAFGAGATVQPFSRPQPARPPALSRRRLLTGAAAAGVVAAAGAGAWMATGPDADARVAALLTGAETTGHGERRSIDLADGSRVTLAGWSAIRADLSGTTRHVELLAGEALFTVAADATRPFVVAAGAGRARALGTTFSVTRDDQTARVVVVAGQVEARAADGAVVALEAGQAVTMGRSVAGAPMMVERVDAAALTAWHRGRLIVAGQPLAQVAARLERDSRLRLIVRGDTARNLPVTGVFNLDDPAGTLAAITRILPVRARRIGPLVILDA